MRVSMVFPFFCANARVGPWQSPVARNVIYIRHMAGVVRSSPQAGRCTGRGMNRKKARKNSRKNRSQNQESRSSPARYARSVQRTVIACTGQNSWHRKHMQQSWLFSGYTPSPLTGTKTPIEQRSTHWCFVWQRWERWHRSGSTYTSVPTDVAGPTSITRYLSLCSRARQETVPGIARIIRHNIIN